jgi:hypothetical protein
MASFLNTVFCGNEQFSFHIQITDVADHRFRINPQSLWSVLCVVVGVGPRGAASPELHVSRTPIAFRNINTEDPDTLLHVKNVV